MQHAIRLAVAGFALAAALSLGTARAADAPPVTAQTAAGLVSGTGGDVRSFKGIPFAAPPLGPLRWKPPQPAPHWAGVRDATAFGPECAQPIPPGAPSVPNSEDCLTLNVWTPAGSGAHLPVMIYIYGGGYAVGAANSPTFDGTSLARHGVVLVTFNYRLNVFGFLAHPALSAESPDRTSGNYGLLDQVAVLHWVQANAAAFGGDPHNVTIVGESAGAGSVSALLTMPRAKGLFARAIMESAPVFRPEMKLAGAEAAGVALAGGADLATLRAMAPADLMKRIPPLDPDTRTDIAITLGPIADNVVLPDERTAYGARKETIVPIIIGNNVNEGSFFARGIPVKTLAMYDAALKKRFGDAAPQARTLYPATDDAGALAAEATIVGDIDINTGVRKMAVTMAKAGAPVYRYLFTRARAGKLPGHSDELPYVFNATAVNGVGAPAPAFDATDNQVSETMETMWTQFAKTGNPNPPGSDAWPLYTVAGDRFIVFGDTVSTGTAFRTPELDFLNQTVGR
jgi:para-nitrobenzyl esterase